MERENVMKKVSIIVPAYNHENLIEKCIRSIMAQSYKYLEILVIDDGSTDKTGNILDTIADQDLRIRVIHQANSGVSVARNRGIEVATGDYITFIDGDDYVGKTYIEKLVSCAIQNEAEMVICGLTKVTKNGSILEKIIPGNYESFTHEEWTFRISAVCSHLYKKELWDKYGIRFSTGVRGEDMPISLFFSAMSKNIHTIQDCEYFYVQHENSAMHCFRGLGKYKLPYSAIEEVISTVQSVGLINSQENFELFVMRILATCYFQLAIGASREKMKELCDYIVRILQQYFPLYYKNSKAKLNAKIDVPISQKMAVKLLIVLARTRMIYPVGWIMSKKEK